MLHQPLKPVSVLKGVMRGAPELEEVVDGCVEKSAMVVEAVGLDPQLGEWVCQDWESQ